MKVCEVCPRAAAHSRRWCPTHYTRFRRTGDPLGVRGTGHGVRRAGEVGYRAVHKRLRYDLGPATDHECRHCSGQAQTWAYDHADPNELIEDGLPYSLDPERYMPLCKACHTVFDSPTHKEMSNR